MGTKRLSERDGEIVDGSVAFTIDKPIADLTRLDALLSAEMGWRKDSGLVVEGIPAEASTDAPVTVWVVRGDVDTNAFKRAVTAYDDAEVLAGATEVSVDDLVAKVESGEDFTAQEIQQALRLLLSRPDR